MKWVTRARPKTDRIACPWLIQRFIDPEAEILYVPPDYVLEVAQREAARSFDAPGAEFTHRETKCSFAVASWPRISSASTPPPMKKTRLVEM